MAILSNLLVHGSGRILNKLYVGDFEVSGEAVFDSLSATSITASSSLTSSGTLSVTGNSTLGGTLRLTKTASISDASLIIGPTDSLYVKLYPQGIQAMNSNALPDTLYINSSGGRVIISNGTIVADTDGSLSATTLISSYASFTSMQSAKGTFDNVNVIGTLKASKYEINSISSLGGDFYIAPIRKYSSSSTFKITAKNTGLGRLSVRIVENNPSYDRSATLAGVQWTENSKIKLSARIGEHILSSVDGVITNYVSSTGTLDCMIYVPDLNYMDVTTNYVFSGSNLENLSVMVYEQADNDDPDLTRPVGIYMTGFGTNNASYIDMYQGNDSRLKPKLRLGKLDELDSSVKVGGVNPTGWGLYAQNVFLEGTIFSEQGNIGGWTIRASDLSIGEFGHGGSAMISIGTNETGQFTENGVLHTIGGSPSGTNYWVFTAGEHFGVTRDGVLYCSDAHISGEITATSGKIAEFNITNSTNSDTHLYKSSIYTQKPINSEATANIFEAGLNSLGSKNSKVFYVFKKNNETDKWQEANGSYIFYILNDGSLYSKGSITAEGNINISGNGSIGGCTMTNGELEVDSAHITSIVGNKIEANSISANKLVVSERRNLVVSNELDPSTAIVSNHPFKTSSVYDDNVIVNGYIQKKTATCIYLPLTTYMENIFQTGDEVYYSITLKGATAGNVYLRIWFYESDHSGTNVVGSAGPIGLNTTDTVYTGTIKLASSEVGNKAFYAIGINDTRGSGNRSQIYCKDAVMYKKTNSVMIADGAVTADKIEAGAITADKIQAGSINASKLVLSDSTNYITVNEQNTNTEITENHPFTDGASIVGKINNSDTYSYFYKQDSTSSYLALSPYTVNSFNEGDELFYSIIIRGASNGTCRVRLWFYGEKGTIDVISGAYTNVQGDPINFTTEEATYTGTIKITNAAAETALFAVGLVDLTKTKVQIYCRQASLRKKAGGNLIVDGSITASKMLISDPTNYIQINESRSASVNISRHSFVSQIIDENGDLQNSVKNNPIISGGYIQKENITQRFIPLSGYTLNTFSDGDELFYTITMKGETSGSGYHARLRLYFYGTGALDNYTYMYSIGGPAIYYTTEDAEYTGTIVIPSGYHNYGYFSIAVADDIGDGETTDPSNASTRKQIYVKDVSLRKKAGGNLIVDGAITAEKIQAGAITAEKIQARSINAQKLVLSDPTNYVTVNESCSESAITENHPFKPSGGVLQHSIVSDGYIQKDVPTNMYMPLTGYTQNTFKPGDELYWSASVKGATVDDTSRFRIIVYFYGPNGVTDNTNNGPSGSASASLYTYFTTEDTVYSGTITISEASASCGFYAIGLVDHSTNRSQIYLKEVSVRMRSGGNLIVNGAITADKISAGAITADKISAGSISITARNILRGTRTLTCASTGTWIIKKFRPSRSTLGTSIQNVQIADSPVPGITQGILLTEITKDDGTALNPGFCQDNYEMKGHAGDVLTYSAWVKVSRANQKISLQAYYFNVTGGAVNENSSHQFIIAEANTWTHISYTTPAIKYDHQKISIGYVYMQSTTGVTQEGDTVTVCALMLEWGHISSAWSDGDSSNNIAGFTIDDDSIRTVNTDVTNNAENSVALSTVDFTRSINEQSRGNLRFAIGSNFGVTGTGKVYANDVDITGVINATAGGSIAGWTINASNLMKGSWGESKGMLLCPAGSGSSKQIGGSDASQTGWTFTSGANFGVTNTGAMYCNSGKIGGISIDSTGIYNGSATLGASGNGNFYLGPSGFSLSDKFVYKTKDGSLALKVSSLSIAGADISAETNVRNLVACSNVNINQSPNHNICSLQLVEGHGLQVGEPVIIQIKGSLSTGKTGFLVCNSGGTVSLSGGENPSEIGPNDYNPNTGIYTKQLYWRKVSGSTTANDTYINIYQMPKEGVAHASSIEWVMLERGTVAHPHKLSDDDLNIMDEVIIGTQTTATAAWTGKSNYILKLTNGVRIKYWLPVASASSVKLTLTLRDGTSTDAIPCYYGGTTNIGTYYGAGSMLSLVYRENVTIGSTTISKGWWADANYNTNTWDRHRYTLSVTADTAIARYALIVCKSNGKYQELRKGTAFLITKPMVMTDTAMDPAGTTKSTTNTYLAIPFNITTATQTIANLAVGQQVYIKGKLSGDTFTPASSGSACLTTNPSEDKTSHYMYVGIATSSTGVYLEQQHPVYVYYNNKFMKIDEVAKTFMYFDANNGLILSQNEITVSDETSTANGSISKCGGNVRLTGTGMQVRSGKNVLAEYGSGITLNYAASGNKAITLDASNGLQMFYNNSSHTLAAQLNASGLVVNSGKIGGTNGITIASNCLYSGSKSAFGTNTPGFFLGTTGFDIQASNGNYFKVYNGENGELEIKTDKFVINTPILELKDDDNNNFDATPPTNLIDWMKIVGARTSMFHVHKKGIELADFNNTYNYPSEIFFHGPKNSYLFFHNMTGNDNWRTGGIISAAKQAFDTSYNGLEFCSRAPDMSQLGVTSDCSLAILSGNAQYTDFQLCGQTSSHIYYTISDETGGRKNLIGAGKVSGSYNLTIGYNELPTIYLRANSCLLKSGAAITSDQRLKKDICDLDESSHDFIMSLKPKKFKYINGTSNRYHAGFIAQQVEQAMNSTIGDFGVFCNIIAEDDGSIATLRYEEIIAPHVAITQEHEHRINELESEITELKEQIKTLQKKLLTT